MRLFFAGLDHTSASVAVRECLAFRPDTVIDALHLLTRPHADYPALLRESVILSTCNRVEIYAVFPHDTDPQAIEDQVVGFLAGFHHLPSERFANLLHFAYDIDVVQHLFETTAGLQSLVLGEAQIQGQARKAFSIAQRAGTAGTVLSRLFNRALACGKRVRRETALGRGAASVSQASIELAARRLGDLSGRNVLLVGSGKVSELAAQNLLAYGAHRLMITNRTYENALELANRYGAQVYRFDELATALTHADIVISSTAAPHYVLHPEAITAALQHRTSVLQHTHGSDAPPAEMLLIDLAVPRDIDPDIASIPGAYVYTVDDLDEVVQDTRHRREAEVSCAQQIVREEVDSFITWLDSQQIMPVLSVWRQRAEALRDAEVQRALRHLGELSPEQQLVVEALSRSLVNKILHTPTLRTRHAAAQGEGERYAEMLRDLWGI